MTDYVNKINNIPIGGNIFDGLPTFVDATLSSGVDLGPSETFTSNLSSILPNDGQDYMCMFEVQSNNLSGVSSTNGYYEVTIHNSTTGDLNNNIWRVVTAGRYHNHGIGRVNSVWLPIFANNRNVTLMQRSTGTDRGARINSFKLKQYYRLGSNGDSGNYIDNITTLEHNLPMGNDTVSGNDFVILRNAAANGLNSVTIAGKCEQTATPSPTNPIPIVCNNGELKCSSNLFDQSLFNTDAGITVTYYTFTIENGTYTMSTNIPYASGSLANVFLFAGQVTSGASSGTNGVTINTPRTITVTNGKYTVAYRSRVSAGDTACNPKDYNWMLARSSSAQSYQPYGEVYADGVTETITDSANNSATAEMLLSIGNLTDTQEILSGAVTRKVGVIILDGTENWTQISGSSAPFALVVNDFVSLKLGNTVLVHSTHFQGVPASATWSSYENLISFTASASSENKTFRVRYLSNTKTLAEFKQFLADQYANGTPVICIYSKTTTTETVTGQTLTTVQGDNTLTISQASIDNLPIEANYDKLGDGPINIPVGGKILAAKEVPINIEPEAAFAFTGSEYKTYDLSQQIPNDGYAYELLLQAYTRSNTNAYCRTYIGWVGADGNYKTTYLQNCGADSNGSIAGANNQRVILQPNSRVIRFGNNSGSATGSCRLQVVSYKRLGTNE